VLDHNQLRPCAHPFTLADLEPASMALRHMVFLENCVSSRMATWHLPSGLFQSPCSHATLHLLFLLLIS